MLRGTDVAVNEFRRWPLLRIQEWVMEAIGVRNEEQELMVGAFRVGVPRYDIGADEFRQSYIYLPLVIKNCAH